MDKITIISLIVVLSAALIGIAVYLYLQKRRSEGLRSTFGPEYYRALKESGDKAHAETALEERRNRVERLQIRPLTREDSARFTDSWHRVQARFVDDPDGAVTEADRLLSEVMSTRGYPVSDYKQLTADISVDHPRVVENYRTAHEIELRHAQGQASTEDLRQAMIHFRTLFMDLVGEPAEIRKAA
jgi:hypothetical protein